MTPALTSLSSLLLALSWTAEPGITYTIQTSSDMEFWETLPFVISGDGDLESHALEMEASPFFARLQFSAGGDSNENGLPDLWEWIHFGYLDVDPSADPDGDGTSTYHEWLDSTDPLDFFNGEFPLIRISSGNEWLVRAGEVSTQALAVSVRHASGEPWANAPLELYFESGYAGILSDGDPTGTAVPSMTEWTDALGRVDPASVSINLLAAALPDQTEVLCIRAGKVSKSVLLQSIGADMGLPPRELRKEVLENGDVLFAWSGISDGTSGFLLEEQDVSGNWIQVAYLEPGQLPEPDPETGLHSLLIPFANN